MAIVRAVKTGVWSDPTVWNTGALPTSADDVYSNTFTVTIDVSPTVLSINNAATTGVTAGGGFVATNGITLTCTGTGLNAGASGTLFSSTLTTGQSANIVGNCQFVGAPGSNWSCVVHNGLGTLSITGNCTGGSAGANTYAINNAGNGTLNITGSCTGGNGSTSPGANNASGGTLNITGSVQPGSNIAPGAINASGGTLNHVGTATASNNSPAITSAGGSLTVTGPFIVAANGVHAIYSPIWRWASTTPVSYYQVRTVNTGAIRTLFTADSVGGNPSVSNVRSGTVYGPNSELTGTCAVPAAGSVALGVAVDNTTGTAVLTSSAVQTALTSQGLTTTRAANLDNLDNLDATVSSRLAASSYTAPPSAATIAAAVWAAGTRTLTAAIDQSSSIASAVWSAVARTITGGTVDTLTNAPSVPSAAQIATQVRTELSTELSRIDVATSTRLAPSGTLARVTLTDTATTLTNAPTVPTPSQIASQVRTELATELGRLDAAVSSRLAPSGTLARVTLVDTATTLTNSPDVPTGPEIASAVRTELAPELARVSNAATTQEVGDIIEEALQ